jgi:hypothetical protein
MSTFVTIACMSAAVVFAFVSGMFYEKAAELRRRKKQFRVPVKFGDHTPPDVPRRRPF